MTVDAPRAPAPSTGVVVVSHQSADDLPACLDALLAAVGIDRVVVVDNASTDGSADIVRRADSPRVTLLALDHNTGFAGGCNRGFAELGDVDVVVTCNPDVVVEPGCLARATAVLGEEPSLGAVAPRLMRADGRIVDSVGQVLARGRLEVRDRGYGRPLDDTLFEPVDVLAPCGALGAFRRSALEDVAGPDGPWEERFFCFWEDLELGWRLVRGGWRVRTVPDAVATHRRGAGADEGNGPLRWRRPPHLEACVVTNRWMTLLRHLHGVDLVTRLPLLLAWDLGVVGAGILRRPSLARHVARRWPLVIEEWRRRRPAPRPRLVELP
jgi:GT2 family glycosyltransferase